MAEFRKSESRDYFRKYIKKFFENTLVDKPQEIPQKFQESTNENESNIDPVLEEKALQFVKEICAEKMDGSRFSAERRKSRITVFLDNRKICSFYPSDKKEKEFPFHLIDFPERFAKFSPNGKVDFYLKERSREEVKKECKDYFIQTLKSLGK